jgi:hypothetical protein
MPRPLWTALLAAALALLPAAEAKKAPQKKPAAKPARDATQNDAPDPNCAQYKSDPKPPCLGVPTKEITDGGKARDVLGIDLSDSHALDFAALEKAHVGKHRIRFAVFLASRGGGSDIKNRPTFQLNWKGVQTGSKDQLIRGAYMMFNYKRQGVTPDQQAKALINELKLAQEPLGGDALGAGTLPPMIDLETMPSGKNETDASEKKIIAADRERIKKELKALIEKLHAEYGRGTMMYVGYEIWDSLQVTEDDEKDFHKHPFHLYIANYNDAALTPTMPKSVWSKWTFWQYYGENKASGVYDIPGLKSAKDISVYNGTLKQLTALAAKPGKSMKKPKAPAARYHGH